MIKLEALIKSKNAGLVIAVASAIIFGLYPPAARAAYADGANAIFMVLATAFTRAAGLVFVCYCFGKKMWPSRANYRPLVSAGFFQAVSVIGIIASLQYLPGPVAIVLVFTHSLMLLLYMTYTGEVKLNAWILSSTLAALLGVTLVVDLWGNLERFSLIGVTLALVAAVATTIRLYVFGKQVRDADPLVVGAQVFLPASLFTLPLLLFFDPLPPVTFEGFLWTALACASLIFGTFGLFWGIAILGPFKNSLILKLEPVFAAFFSIIILNEFLEVRQYIGMLLILTSVTFYQWQESKVENRCS